MKFKDDTLTGCLLSQIVSVCVCLSAFSFLMPPLLVQTRGESAEEKCPAEEDGEDSEEELIAGSSARRRSKLRRQSHTRRRAAFDDIHVASYAGCTPVMAGQRTQRAVANLGYASLDFLSLTTHEVILYAG